MTVRGTYHYLDTYIWETFAEAFIHLPGNTQCVSSFVASLFFLLLIMSNQLNVLSVLISKVRSELNSEHFLHCFLVLLRKYLLKLRFHKNEVILRFYWCNGRGSIAHCYYIQNIQKCKQRNMSLSSEFNIKSCSSVIQKICHRFYLQ